MADRARAWRHAAHGAVCDVVEPWAHGTVVRATRYPSYFDFNVVRVESEPGMSVDELVAFADEALADLAHRRIDFDVVEAADARRSEFEARGWSAMRLLWMRHGGGPVPGCSEIAVEAVAYDAVHELRVRWMAEDGVPEPDAAGYHAQAREVALAQGAEVLAVREAGELVAFAQLIRSGAAAEIHQVFVLPAFRGRGRGTRAHARGDRRGRRRRRPLDQRRRREAREGPLRAARLPPGAPGDGAHAHPLKDLLRGRARNAKPLHLHGSRVSRMRHDGRRSTRPEALETLVELLLDPELRAVRWRVLAGIR